MDKNNSPVLSVIIPTYKDWDNLKQCLESLNKQSLSKDNYEVIVVNNNPEDTCPFILPSDNMKICEEKTPGSYAARNKGIRESRGRYFAFTDSDCIPDAEWLEKGLAKVQQTEKRVAGEIIMSYKNKDYLTLAELFEKYYAFRDHKKSDNDIILTANMFVRKKLFEEIGLFNSNTMSGGDVEWSERAEKKKYKKLFDKDVIVYHPARDTLKKLFEKNKRIVEGKIKLYKSESHLFYIYKLIRAIIPPFKTYVKLYYNNRKVESAYNLIRLYVAIYLVRIHREISLFLLRTKYKSSHI